MFKVGDLVTVIRVGLSDASKERIGETVAVFEIGGNYIITGPDCSGIYLDEIEYSPLNNSPLIEALS